MAKASRDVEVWRYVIFGSLIQVLGCVLAIVDDVHNESSFLYLIRGIRVFLVFN